MNNTDKATKEFKEKLAVIDLEMKSSLGSSTVYRDKNYKIKYSEERKFLRQIFTNSTEVLNLLDSEDVMNIIRSCIQLSSKETSTIRNWIQEEEEVFVSGVIPCNVLIIDEESYNNVHSSFIKSKEEYKTFSEYFSELSVGYVNVSIICRLYDIEDYINRELGDVFGEEIQLVSDKVSAESGLLKQKFTFYYSSQGEFFNITNPMYKPIPDILKPYARNKNSIFLRFMGIPYIISGKKKHVLKASEEFNDIGEETVEKISKLISEKFSVDVRALLPVEDQELEEFVETWYESLQNANENVKRTNSSLKNELKALSPPNDIRDAVLLFFNIANLKCSGCGKIHDEESYDLGIMNEQQWDSVMNIFIDFLRKRKDDALKILANDREIVVDWAESADALRQLLLGNMNL
jgi:hypothetical protein